MGHNDPFCVLVAAGMDSRGLTLRGLCRAAGLDPSFFSKVLAGKRSPPCDETMLRRIAAALEIGAAELIVAAGRIPAEWRAIREDPELFREINERAMGKVRAQSSPPPRQGSPAATQRPPHGGRISEELL